MKGSTLATGASLTSLALVMAGFGIAGLPVAPAQAQTPLTQANDATPRGSATVVTPAGANGIADIVVTARRREESLQRVPVAVSALSGDQLQRENVVAIDNLNGKVPALRITRFQGADTFVVSIRGQRNSQVQPGQDPAIGVYFAEVPTGFQVGLSLGVFDLENIQVLKGPQGTLFGRNSTGGAILLSPAKPQDEFGGSVRTGFEVFRGGTGFTSTEVLNVPVGEHLALRFGLNTVDQGGWQKNIADPAAVASAAEFPATTGFVWPFGKQNLNDRLGSQHSQEWRVGADFKPTDNFDNYLVYQGAHLYSNQTVPRILQLLPGSRFAALYGPIIAKQAAADFWSTQSAWKSPLYFRENQVVDTATLNLGDVTLKNIVGAKWVHRSVGFDGLGAPVSLASNLTNYYKQTGHEVSEEFQIQGRSLSNQLTWTAGAFYFDNVLHQYSAGSGFGLAIRPANAFAKTVAGYGQATYQLPFLEGLSITAGVRHTTDKRRMDKQQFAGNVPACRLSTSPTNAAPPPNCTFDASAIFNKWTYNGTLDYQLDARSLVYFSYSRGYRAGGFNISEVVQSNYVLGYQPETVDNFEIGLKKDWNFGFPVRTNIAAYTQKFTNVVRQAQNPATPVFAILTNASRARLKGVEAEISVKPLRGLDVGVSYGYVDAKYTAPFYPFGQQANGTSFNAEGFKFALVPKQTVSANASYELPVNEDAGKFVLSATYAYQSRIYWDDTQQGTSPGCVSRNCGLLDTYSQKPFGLLDLRLDWRNILKSRFDLSVWSTNVTNTKYNTYATNLANVVGFAVYPGQPRFVGLDVTYRFGKKP